MMASRHGILPSSWMAMGDGPSAACYRALLGIGKV
jgi:hypothetical protein